MKEITPKQLDEFIELMREIHRLNLARHKTVQDMLVLLPDLDMYQKFKLNQAIHLDSTVRVTLDSMGIVEQPEKPHAEDHLNYTAKAGWTKPL